MSGQTRRILLAELPDGSWLLMRELAGATHILQLSLEAGRHVDAALQKTLVSTLASLFRPRAMAEAVRGARL